MRVLPGALGPIHDEPETGRKDRHGVLGGSPGLHQASQTGRALVSSNVIDAPTSPCATVDITSAAGKWLAGRIVSRLLDQNEIGHRTDCVDHSQMLCRRGVQSRSTKIRKNPSFTPLSDLRSAQRHSIGCRQDRYS
jgi:hypothetical protein